MFGKGIPNIIIDTEINKDNDAKIIINYLFKSLQNIQAFSSRQYIVVVHKSNDGVNLEGRLTIVSLAPSFLGLATSRRKLPRRILYSNYY